MSILARIITAVVGLGIGLAGIILWKIPVLRRVRWVIAGLTAYGVVALAYATATGTTLRDALTGNGLFQSFPYVLQAAVIGCLVVLPLGWIASLLRSGVPAFREKSLCRHLYDAVALTTCVALVAASFPYDGRTKHRMDPKERTALLDRSLQALEDGDRQIPRDRWDPDYVVNIVGRDPQKLFTWVKSHTYWIPYRGVLRGPVGVLMDAQGNSLDRALLLATLLEKAGQSVRLAHGELTREQAVALLPGLVSRRVLDFSSPERTDFLPDLDIHKPAAQYGLDESSIDRIVREQKQALFRVSNELETRTADQTTRLLQVAGSGDRNAEWTKRYEASIQALRDHWWVQREDGVAWVDLDLLPIVTPAARETTSIKDMPADLYHQISIRVVAEQWSTNGPSNQKVLEYALHPADFIGQPLSLQFWPTDWVSDSRHAQTVSDVRAAARDEHAWIAALAVGRKVVASATLQDTIVDSSSGNTGKGESNKGGPFGGFGAALDETLNHPSKSAGSSKLLSAVWLEYEIRVPGEPPRTIRRTVFDLLGPATRASGTPTPHLDNSQKVARGLALSMKTEMLPVVCELAPEFVAHLATESVTGSRGLIRSVISGSFAIQSDTSQKDLTDATPPASSLLALALLRLGWNKKAEHIFIDRPNLLTRHESLVDTANGVALQNATDIVANEVAIDLTARDAFALRLEQGVRDTNAEALLTTGKVIGNTSEAYAGSSNWALFTPAQQSAVEGLAFSDDIRRSMDKELADGYVLVAPHAPVEKSEENFSSWWRIDPQTGSTLGFASNGWGQAAEESHQLRMAITFARAFDFEYVLCQSFPLAVNSMRVINEEMFGGWHPSWTAPGPKSQDPIEIADENMHACVVQAIAAGFLATLPLVMLTWEVSPSGRGLAFVKRVMATEEEVEAASQAKPCLTALPLPTRAPLAMSMPIAALIFQGPCGPRDTLPDPNKYGPNHTVVEPLKQPVRLTRPPTDEELQEAYAAVKAAEKKMLPQTQEFVQYMSQPVGRDPQIENELFNRATYTYNMEYSPACDRYLKLKYYRDLLGPGGGIPPGAGPGGVPPAPPVGNSNPTGVAQQVIVGSAGTSDALGGPPSSGRP